MPELAFKVMMNVVTQTWPRVLIHPNAKRRYRSCTSWVHHQPYDWRASKALLNMNSLPREISQAIQRTYRRLCFTGWLLCGQIGRRYLNARRCLYGSARYRSYVWFQIKRIRQLTWQVNYTSHQKKTQCPVSAVPAVMSLTISVTVLSLSVKR